MTTGFTVTELDHVQWAIPPGALPSARHFYQDLLGLHEVRHPTLDKPGTLRFAVGHHRLDLSEGPTPPESPQAHLALRVSRLHLLAAALRAAGHTLSESPLPSGEARLYVADPFGHLLEFIEPLPAAALTEGGLHASGVQRAV